MKKILVIGSSNVDYVIKSKKFPKPGETLIGSNFEINLGGKGANQAVAATLAGGDVTFLTCLGNDINKDFVLNELSKYGVKVKPIIKDSPTGSAMILVEEETAENEIVVNPGANILITKEDIDNNLDLIKEADYLLFQLEIPVEVIEYIVDIAYVLNKEIIINPAPYQYLDLDIIRKATYLTPNENELQKLVNGTDNYEDNVHKLLDLGLKNVIVTLGSNGSYLINKNNKIKIDSYKVKAVDTTGAGDAYNGSFVSFLSQGYSQKEALDLASVASALSVTKNGASKSYATKEEILKLKK